MLGGGKGQSYSRLKGAKKLPEGMWYINVIVTDAFGAQGKTQVPGGGVTLTVTPKPVSAAAAGNL